MKIFRSKEKKKQLVSRVAKIAVVSGILGVMCLANSETASAHGFVEAPASRAFMGNQLRNQPDFKLASDLE